MQRVVLVVSGVSVVLLLAVLLRLAALEAAGPVHWDFTLEGDSLCVAPLQGFYHTPGLGRNEIRMAYVLEQDTLRRCIQVLEAALAAWAKR